MKTWFFCAMCLYFFLLPLQAEEMGVQGVVQVQDDIGEPVEGAVFQLYYYGQLQEELHSDKDGNIILRHLTDGEYLLLQSQADENHQKYTERILFHYDADMKGLTWNIVNKRKLGKVRLQFHDDDYERKKQTISLQVLDEKDTLVRKLDTDTSFVELENLPLGTYRIHVQGHSNADHMKEDVTFSITPKNYKRDFTLHLYLHSSSKQTEKPIFALCFMAVVLTGIIGILCYFKKHSFTQFLDDFIV